jgi:hypothetical protein
MASVVGDKWQCRPLFILKQAFSKKKKKKKAALAIIR